MKILVIYYSFEGNCRCIANEIATTLGADILKLTPKNEIKSKGFMKYFWGGRQVFMRKSPPLSAFEHEPDDYDFLIIGTPVWSFTYAPAVRTFLHTTSFNDKKIALFICSDGWPGKTIAHLRRELSGNEIISDIGFVNPLTHEKEKQCKEARDWAQALVAKRGCE